MKIGIMHRISHAALFQSVFLISFKALLDAIKRRVIVFLSSRVRNSVANLAQSRLIDARSTSIIHESFSLLVKWLPRVALSRATIRPR